MGFRNLVFMLKSYYYTALSNQIRSLLEVWLVGSHIYFIQIKLVIMTAVAF